MNYQECSSASWQFIENYKSSAEMAGSSCSPIHTTLQRTYVDETLHGKVGEDPRPFVTTGTWEEGVHVTPLILYEYDRLIKVNLSF